MKPGIYNMQIEVTRNGFVLRYHYGDGDERREEIHCYRQYVDLIEHLNNEFRSVLLEQNDVPIDVAGPRYGYEDTGYINLDKF